MEGISGDGTSATLLESDAPTEAVSRGSTIVLQMGFSGPMPTRTTSSVSEPAATAAATAGLPQGRTAPDLGVGEANNMGAISKDDPNMRPSNTAVSESPSSTGASSSSSANNPLGKMPDACGELARSPAQGNVDGKSQ
jgi:hypothetical protein